MDIVALKRIVYGGKRYFAGDKLTTTRKDGRALVCIGKAIPAPTLYNIPVVEEEVIIETPTEDVTEKPKAKPVKRTYNRRDMVAEK